MKTENYIGKQDENRGIIAFAIVFVIVLIIICIIVAFNKIKSVSEEKGISSVDEMYYDLQKTNTDVVRFELDGSNLILDGDYKENVNEYLLSNYLIYN